MLTLSGCLLLAATARLAQAAPHTKTCAHINGCSAAASSPQPLPTAPRAVQPEAASHLVVAVATAPKSTAKARHTSGSLMTNAEREGVIRCGGYRFKAPTTFQFKLQPVSTTRGTFTIGFTYEIAERITNTTADGVQFCLGASFRFKTLSGRAAPARRLPDGTRGHVGLLPPCPQPLPPPGLTSAPCVEAVTTVKDLNGSTTGVDVILKARIPTAAAAVATVRGAGDSVGGDPWGGG